MPLRKKIKIKSPRILKGKIRGLETYDNVFLKNCIKVACLTQGSQGKKIKAITKHEIAKKNNGRLHSLLP